MSDLKVENLKIKELQKNIDKCKDFIREIMWAGNEQVDDYYRKKAEKVLEVL